MRASLVARRTAVALVTAALSSSLQPRVARALEVQERSEQEVIERALYAAPLPEISSYQQQVSDAITIQSMRGVWTLREYFSAAGSLPAASASGVLTFRGAEFEERGSVSYSGDSLSAGQNGRGPWIIKADGFGRSPAGKRGGAIERKALWKLRRRSSASEPARAFTYAGRINVASYAPDGLPDARIEGEIIELFGGGKPKGGSERAVGKFQATLERRLTAEEEAAMTDSAAAGGQPEVMSLTSVMDSRLVYK